MSDIIKIGQKPNIVKIKRSEWHHEMFTTNLDRIKQFITVSDYSDKIDPNVILKINKKAVTLSEEDFSYYVGSLAEDELIMLYLYESLIDSGSRKRITRILKKLIDPDQSCNENELIDLMQWESGNHSYYCIMVAIENGEII